MTKTFSDGLTAGFVRTIRTSCGEAISGDVLKLVKRFMATDMVVFY